MNENEIKTMIHDDEVQFSIQKRRLTMWSHCRLISAFVFFAGLVFGIKEQFIPGYVAAAIALVAFCYFVYRFNEQQKQIDLMENRLEVLFRYDARTKGLWDDFADDGSQYIQKDDFLSSDLDLFGPHSLYQYISVAHTLSGRDALMRLLTRPNLKMIQYRQASVLELLKDDELAVTFEALGIEQNHRLEKDEREAEKRLRQYAVGTGNNNMTQLKILGYGMPLVTFFAIGAALAGSGSWLPVLYSFCLQILTSILLAGTIQTEKDSVMVLAKKLGRIEERIKVMQEPEFESPYLKEMQHQMANAKDGIRALNRIVNMWQMRENFILYWPLVGLFAWDFNCCITLDKWRSIYGSSFINWMDWIGEVEALYSLGSLSRVRPNETSVPEIVNQSAPLLEMKDGKHPLLNPHEVIGNDYQQGADTVIITGSNMSGKSTFMRTIALNAVLAYAGGTVAATAFRISPMKIFTSMRVHDDVSEGISSFYGEIIRIKKMVQWSKKERPMLVFVDEIFKGTNSTDRIVGARAAIRKLTAPWMMTIVTTHDFELCALADTEEIHGKNFHFEEHYEGDNIAFDYKIRPGRCTTTNAQHLMRIAGLLDEQDIQLQEEKENAHVL